MTEPNYKTIKVWYHTYRTLKKLAAEKPETLAALIDRLISQKPSEEVERDTWQRTDHYIALLETGRQWLPRDERRDLALLLRRYRKLYFGSALIDSERAEGKAEISP